MRLGLVRPSIPDTQLRRAVKRLLETVLEQAGLPAPLRIAAQGYFASTSDAQLGEIVNVLEGVVKELRNAQHIDSATSADARSNG